MSYQKPEYNYTGKISPLREVHILGNIKKKRFSLLMRLEVSKNHANILEELEILGRNESIQLEH